MLNASIPMSVQPMQIENPLNAMARVLQVQGMQDERALGRMKMEQYRRDVDRQNKMAEILGAGGAEEDVEQRLLQGGFLDQVQGMRKSRTENRKGAAAAEKDEIETRGKVMAQYRDALSNVNTPQAAAQWMAAQYRDPILGKFAAAREPLEQAVQSIPQDPQQFAQWRQQAALGMTKFIELNKPNIQTRNTGGTTDTIAVEGLTGKTTTLNQIRNTQSPDSIASQATAIRGQNMVDARARETAERGKWQYDAARGGLVNLQTGEFKQAMQNGQPVGPAEKALTEGQGKANLFGSRMRESDRILTGLEGKYSPMAVNAKMGAENIPGVGGVAGPVANAMLTAEGQQAEQAQRDFVNAVLRRESGAVISEQEFKNAQKQYFPQPNDSPEVLSQKRRNRQMAIQGIEAEVPGGFRSGGGASGSFAGGGGGGGKVVDFGSLK